MTTTTTVIYKQLLHFLTTKYATKISSASSPTAIIHKYVRTYIHTHTQKNTQKYKNKNIKIEK